MWPWRCAAHAQGLTRALFESRSDDPRHRLLNQFASQAATELARGALRTGSADPRHYLDELFAAAERASLPAAPPSAVALPPEPVRYLDARRVRPLYRGAGGSVVAAEQPLDDGALRVLVGRGERRLCDFDRDLDAPECARVAALDRARRPALTASLYPRMPGYLTRDGDDELAVGPLLHPARLDAPLAAAAAAEAVSRSDDPALRDTRAQALHRLGRWDEAIPMELDALDHARADPAPGFYATQLARFLAARTAARGPWVDGAEAPSATWAAGAVTVALPARTQARRVVVLVREGAALKALVATCFAPGEAATQRVAVPGGAAGWRAEVALVRATERCGGAAAGRAP